MVKYESTPIHLYSTTVEDLLLKDQIVEWSKAFRPFQRTVHLAMEDYRPNSTIAAIINAGGTRSDIDSENVTRNL